jgi:hypothetical protein
VILFREIERDVGNFVVYDLLCGNLSARGDLSAPSEPNARFVLKCGLDGNFKPAGARRRIFLGNGNSETMTSCPNSGPLRNTEGPSLSSRPATLVQSLR